MTALFYFIRKTIYRKKDMKIYSKKYDKIFNLGEPFVMKAKNLQLKEVTDVNGINASPSDTARTPSDIVNDASKQLTNHTDINKITTQPNVIQKNASQNNPNNNTTYIDVSNKPQATQQLQKLASDPKTQDTNVELIDGKTTEMKPVPKNENHSYNIVTTKKGLKNILKNI